MSLALLWRAVFANVGTSNVMLKGGTGSFYFTCGGGEHIHLSIFTKFSQIKYWLQKEISESYRKLWESIKLIVFLTSYIAECGFSAITQLLTEQRNRLQITNRGDL